MAAKKKPITTTSFEQAPKDLDGHPFYGFDLDEDQVAFRNAIWDPSIKIVWCDAAAGSGKTLVSFATANLMYHYHLYDGIVYIVSSYGEKRMGYLPGDITTNSEVYMEPLYQAIIKCNEDPFRVVNTDSMVSQKGGDGYVTAITHTFLRGTNLENKVIIIDEAQNYTVDELRKTITRISDSCKVIIIGHHLQCDIEERSGFTSYLEYFRQFPEAKVCELKTNHRGWISRTADAFVG